MKYCESKPGLLPSPIWTVTKHMEISFSFIHKTSLAIKQRSGKIYQFSNRGGWGNRLKEVSELNRKQLCGPERAVFSTVTALFSSKRNLEMRFLANMKVAKY